ncbi:MAG: SRPBCC domain-containing protein [Bacteroidota bacterium]
MENEPLIVEYTYSAPIDKVWKAITDKDQMKEWYFDLQEFKPEKGFKFSFTGGDENVQYVHNCEVIEADPPNKLSHTWTYEKNPGHSIVTWELFREGDNQTKTKLTHKGLPSFSNGDPNFEVSSFTKGWNSILGESLKKYLEKES